MKKYFNSTDAKNLIKNYGFALFPVHGIAPDGHCTCGSHSCANKGKHPATKNGFEDATKDIKQLADLWAKRSNLNVGIATGALSGVFVIDIDSDAGEAALNALGAIPATLTATTGKGKHLFFKYPSAPVITKRGIIAGVDVRGDGGYVVGAGSNHASGAYYDFVNPLEVIADAPEFILDMVVKSRIRTEPKAQLQLDAPKSSLQLTGWAQDDVRQHLAHINPDCGYDEWIAVGMALKSENHGFHLWDEWSSRGIKYDPNNMRPHWKSFQGSGVSYGTVVHMAKQGGWKPAHSQQIRSVVGIPASGKEERFDPETGEILPNEPVVQKSGLYYIKAKDIKPSIEANDFVQGTLEEGALSVVYGESNCGKTFFMTDMCFHIATGTEWRGKRVEQGGVIYAALEGKSGISNRVAAYKQENMMLDTNMPFAVMPCQLDFFNENNNIDEFIDLLKRASDDMGSVKLVVIDTLARALMGGDENSGQDMGVLVAYADKIRHSTGAHLTFIHHSGKDKARGARGHSSLRAAVDTEIEISRNENEDYSVVKFAKQREMEMAEDLAFSLKVVEIGKNRHGEAKTSCVVVPADAPIKERAVKAMSAIQAFVFDSLVAAIIDRGTPRNIDGNEVNCVTYMDLRDYLTARGFRDYVDDDKAKNATINARVSLKKMGKINFNQSYIWLVNDG